MKFFIMLLWIFSSTAYAASRCEIVSAKLCPYDDFSLGCAGKYGYQVVCEDRSRVFMSRTQAEGELLELKKMYTQNFELLFEYYSSEMDLIEIKRTDLSPRAPKSDTYKWIVIFRRDGELVPLTFVDMQTQGEETLRTFKEGELRSLHGQASFHYRGTLYRLNLNRPSNVSTYNLNLITGFLNGRI